MTAAEVLRAARALIPTPETWTQGAYARDATGRAVHWAAPEAVCRCADGALLASGASALERVPAREMLVARFSFFACLPDWNDARGRTHAEVLDVFDMAIRLAEAGAP